MCDRFQKYDVVQINGFHTPYTVIKHTDDGVYAVVKEGTAVSRQVFLLDPCRISRVCRATNKTGGFIPGRRYRGQISGTKYVALGRDQLLEQKVGAEPFSAAPLSMCLDLLPED